jgi:hypothetical protein
MGFFFGMKQLWANYELWQDASLLIFYPLVRQLKPPSWGRPPYATQDARPRMFS